jgi:hypothetical protein
LITLFSSHFIAAFLEGNIFQSTSLLYQLSRLRVAQCDEQQPQSTFALQKNLSIYLTFRDYFGHIQDARETFLYLAHLIETERGDGQRFCQMMTIPVIQHIVYDCNHEETIAVTQYIVDLHEEYVKDLPIPLGTHILHGSHREERVVDHQCGLCAAYGCRIRYSIHSLPPIVVLGVIREQTAVAQKLSLPLTFIWSEADDDVKEYGLVGCVCYTYPRYHFYAIVSEGNDVWMKYSDGEKESWPPATECIVCERVRYAIYEIREKEANE